MRGDLEASVREACVRAGAAPDEELLAAVLALRLAAHAEGFVPRADAVSTLRELRGAGLALGLITNCSSEVPELWGASELAPLVDVAVFSAVEGLGKPAREIYERTVARLGVAADECVFVGDDGGNGELDGAAAAGMIPVLLRPGDTHPPEGWTGLAVERLSELPALVARLS